MNCGPLGAFLLLKSSRVPWRAIVFGLAFTETELHGIASLGSHAVWCVEHWAWRPDETMGALGQEQPPGSLSEVSGVTVPDFRLLAPRAAAALLSFRLAHLWHFNRFLGPL